MTCLVGIPFRGKLKTTNYFLPKKDGLRRLANQITFHPQPTTLTGPVCDAESRQRCTKYECPSASIVDSV
eukprot:CAMPEP_0116824126 /NCGR_PEP_ID=MMETSP0418-20121206/1225_1 /TAXON_ID=1158023 /ORGANISM="Astrosyne radiata, Strain 13vi08-1A" /LENGTH=69 /DNA_ID=CAMNT_0004452465 /DNA_START=162 /DNA_END=371 /DNA_ORIENTATION=+